jgi:thymidylate kinase
LKNLLIVGLDGAGKTTHAYTLMKELGVRGIKTRYVYMRGYGRVFITIPFLALSRLLGFTRVHALKNGKKVSEYLFFKNKAFCTLWPWLSLFDAMFYSFLVFNVGAFFFNQVVVSDRSVIDTLVDIAVDTQNQDALDRYGRFFLNLIPKKSFITFFDVEERIALGRKEDVISLSYLRMRRDLYRRLAGKSSWIMLNANVDFYSVHRKFLERTLLEYGFP